MSNTTYLIWGASLLLACSSSEPSRSGGAGVGGGRPGLGEAGAAGAAIGGSGGLGAGNPTGVAGQGQGTAGVPPMAMLGDCAGISVKAEAQLLPTDVIWAIDTSGSMTASFPAIQQALNDFSTKVVAAGIDAHIILLAGAGAGLGTTGLCVPPPLGAGACGAAATPGGAAADSNEPSFLHLDLPFGATQGMAVLLDNHAGYAHLLRPNARTQLVMTEDGAPPMTSAAVTEHIEGRAMATATPAWNPPLLPGSWVFNGVICESGTGTGTCLLAFGLPTTTLELISNSGGLVSDLDDAGNAGAPDPFAALLDRLAEAVIVGAELGCEYAIPPAPPGETLDPALVNVLFTDGQLNQTILPRLADGASCADNVAWTYDNPQSPTQVQLCPAACDLAQADVQGQIDVTFGCETQVLRPD